MFEKLSPQAAVLQKGLDAVWKRNEAIAANIANAETPGYKSIDVDFESVFRAVLGTDRAGATGMTGAAGSSEAAGRPAPLLRDPDDLARLEPAITENRAASMRLDGNNVDIDAEMADLAKNTILYDTLTYAMSREIGRLRLIINEGK